MSVAANKTIFITKGVIVDIATNRAGAGFAQLPELLTVAQSAELAGVSKMTMYRMLRAGKVAAVKVGTQWRVNRRALASALGILEAA